jgi:sporulation protein YlmC with PRC-barrel domain
MRHDNEDLHRGSRTGAATMEGSGIVPLRDMRDFQVASGDPDVRGWDVIANDGRSLGKVHELLVDTGAQRVRYLDVELERAFSSGPGDQPLGQQGMPAGTVTGPGVVQTDPRVTGELDKAVDRGRRILVPIGFARLDESHDRVYLDNLDSHDVAILPEYREGMFSRDYETGLRQRYDQGYTPTSAGDFYAHEHYNEDRFYGTRRGRRS